MRVWRCAKAGTAAAEDLAPGQQLSMNFQSDDGFKSHGSQTLQGMIESTFRLRIRAPWFLAGAMEIDSGLSEHSPSRAHTPGGGPLPHFMNTVLSSILPTPAIAPTPAGFLRENQSS